MRLDLPTLHGWRSALRGLGTICGGKWSLKMISRRQLLYFSTLLFFSYPFAKLRCFAGAGDRKGVQRYPLTLDILKKAYWSEMSASRHYVAYCRKAISDNFPNIAYLFSSFSASERIHADNYRKLILSLDSDLKAKEISILECSFFNW